MNSLRIYSLGALVLLAFVVVRCAQPVSPTGGPRDEVAPEVSKTTPPNQTLNFKGKEVKIIFNEAVKAPTIDKEIFISPLTKRPKIIRSDNAKRIRIKFVEELRPNTTYVITLTEVKDNNESNPLEEAFTLAFSTGDVLDSMKIKGKVVMPVGAKDKVDMTILLFDADSVLQNNFSAKRPAYITKTDESGSFEFKYLRNAPFKAFGLVDGDQSLTYSLPNEMIAISPDTVIVFPDDSTSLATVTLYGFLPDEIAPQLRNYVWLGKHSLAVKFSENLRLDSLQLMVTDTLNQDTIPLTEYTFLKQQEPELMIYMPRPKEQFSHLHFSGIEDSLGNRLLDTVLRVSPDRVRKVENPLIKKSELNLEKQAYQLLPYRKFEESDADYFFLTDTAKVKSDSLKRRYKLNIERKGYQLLVKPDTILDPLQLYVLNVDGKFFSDADTLLQDSIFQYPFKWFDPEEYGSISGVVRFDSTYNGPIVLQFLNSKLKIVREAFDTVFTFNMLPIESYTVRIIMDADSNGIWTPGQIWPVQLPEKIYEDNQPLSIRANWDFEDHVVQIGASSPPRESKEKPEKKGARQQSGNPDNRPTGGPSGRGGRP